MEEQRNQELPAAGAPGVREVRIPAPGHAGPHAIEVGGVDVVLVRSAGEWRAYQGRCPHQGALLGEGELDGDELVCRNHRWRFDAQTGERRGGAGCLRACSVRAAGDELIIDASALSRLAPAGASGSASASAATATRQLADLPGPRPLPILGSAHKVKVEHLHEILEAWAREYGPLYRVKFGPQWVVVSSDPDINERVLRARPEDFQRDPKIAPLYKHIGMTGVFSAEGAEWRPQRQLAMAALANRNLRTFYPVLLRTAERFRRRWERAADAGKILIVEDEIRRFTVDVVTHLAFNYDVNTIEQEGDVIQRQLETVLPMIMRRLLALVPWWKWRWLPIPEERRADRALRDLHAWLRTRITDARERLAANPAAREAPSNFLEAMLVARDDQGQPFPDEIIVGNALTMLVAGESTTAQTIAWIVHHMIDRPDAIATLRAELDRELGDASAPPTIEAVGKLTYTNAIAQEVMRLRPVGPAVGLEALRDVVIGDVAIPARTAVMVLVRPPVLDPARFAAPHEFRPERWLDGGPTADNVAHDARVHMPFGTGPRICPGRGLALLEIRVLASTIFSSFELERVGSADDVRELFAVTLAPQGLKVRVHRRASGGAQSPTEPRHAARGAGR
ncbi:MAG TPA: cytochrome P450 [Kofleriaceae bacterium]|nr:cytochrome P450 [Kofleriaceae bacterium]